MSTITSPKKGAKSTSSSHSRPANEKLHSFLSFAHPSLYDFYNQLLEANTWSDLVIMCGGPVQKHVFDLKELVRTISSNDGETETLRAFSERRLQHGSLQLRWIPCKTPHSSARLLCWWDNGGRKNWQMNTGRESKENYPGLLSYFNCKALISFSMFCKTILHFHSDNVEIWKSSFISAGINSHTS